MKDIYLSYLPLAHIMEQIAVVCQTVDVIDTHSIFTTYSPHFSSSVVKWCSFPVMSKLYLKTFLLPSQPFLSVSFLKSVIRFDLNHFFVAVPRLLNKIYDTIHEKVRGNPVKTWILNKAIESKTKHLEQYDFRKNTFWDLMFFEKIRQKFGGNIRFVVSGSAACNPTIVRFVQCILSCDVSVFCCCFGFSFHSFCL